MKRAAWFGCLLVVSSGLAAAPLGCGGKAVMDGSPGSGGSGGSTTTTTHSTTSTSSTGTPTCASLLAALQAALAEATACNSCSNTDQCQNGPLVYDTCGCQVGANSTTPDKAAAANAAYQAWTAKGCGPYECQEPCYGSGTPWICVNSAGSGCTASCMAGVYGY